MNNTTKAKREKLIDDARRLLLAAGYDAAQEATSQPPYTATVALTRPIIKVLAQRTTRARAWTAVSTALRQMRQEIK